MFGSPAAGKPGDGEVGSAPEEVHGAALPDETSAEHLEDAIRLHKDSPEPVRILRIVRPMRLVLLKGDDRVRNLVWLRINPHVDVELPQLFEQASVESSHRLRLEGEAARAAVARLH